MLTTSTLLTKPKFIEKMMESIGKALDMSKIEDNNFRFTGTDVKQMEDGVEILINNYAESIEEIKIREDKLNEKLTQEEIKVLRKFVGKINWPTENTRPDLAIHTLALAKRQKNAVLKDLRALNREVKKICERDCRVMFMKIGEKEDLCVHGISDASFHTEQNSVCGEMILLERWFHCYTGSQG